MEKEVRAHPALGLQNDMRRDVVDWNGDYLCLAMDRVGPYDSVEGGEEDLYLAMEHVPLLFGDRFVGERQTLEVLLFIDPHSEDHDLEVSDECGSTRSRTNDA